jgi:aquaporin Z
MRGLGVAWLAEAMIAFLMMSMVLIVSNRHGLARYTGLCAGALVASFILVESPVSGMSMNPARSAGSAVWAHVWSGLWIYFTAPPVGMLVASQVYAMTFGRGRVYCAKLNHFNHHRCIFRCRFREMVEPTHP